MYEDIINQLFSRYPRLAHPQQGVQGASMKVNLHLYKIYTTWVCVLSVGTKHYEK